jgi:polyvinyl alcohol dehydrogenase (cytochrome)
VNPQASQTWNGWGVDLRNTRFQPSASAGLAPTEVPRLKVKWAFGFPGVSAAGSQVTVVGGRAYVGSRNGIVYSLDAKTGCIVWAFEADAGVRSSPVVGASAGGNGPAVYFGDAHAQVYALDAASGVLRWKVTVDGHGDAMITGAVAFHNGRVYAGVSSIEEGAAVVPSYECCTFRGSVVSLDAAGPRCGSVHDLEAARKTTAQWAAAVGSVRYGPRPRSIRPKPMHISDNYSNPPTRDSDAIMALALDTGRILWTGRRSPATRGTFRVSAAPARSARRAPGRS